MLEVAEATTRIQHQRVDKSEILTVLQAVQVGTSVLPRSELFLVNLDNDRLKVVVLILYLHFVVSWLGDLDAEVAHVVDQACVLAAVHCDHGLREVEELSSLFYNECREREKHKKSQSYQLLHLLSIYPLTKCSLA